MPPVYRSRGAIHQLGKTELVVDELRVSACCSGKVLLCERRLESHHLYGGVCKERLQACDDQRKSDQPNSVRN